MNTFPKKYEQGFSLVETLVAITILLIVITGPMAISSQTAKSTSFSSEQVVAFFLAQEGVEIAQKGRDDFILLNFSGGTETWDDFIDTGGDFRRCFESTGCGLEIADLPNPDGSLKAPIACTGTNCRLYYNAGGDRSRYTHTVVVGNETPYTRVVKFERVPDVAGAEQVRVRSVVTWRTGSQRQQQEVEVESYLFKVYEDRP